MDIKQLVPWGRKDLQIRRDDDPFMALQRQINQIFDNFFDGFAISPLWGLESGRGPFNPRMDLSDTDKQYRVTVELPGLDEKDVEISLANNVLTIKGEKKQEKEEKRKDYHRMERSYGLFKRNIAIPEGVDLEKVDASFRKGLLIINLPKTEEMQKETKTIPIKAA